MKKLSSSLVFVAAGAALLSTGCATKKYVQQEVATAQATVNTRVDGVETQVEQNQTKLGEHDKQITELSQTAQDALARATAAGKLAEGKLMYETVLSDDKVKFGVNKAEISDAAKAALDAFAAPLRSDNHNVYIEIQGHTDSTGSESFNHKLGLERAEAVRRYLNQAHNIPLHRVSVISYGEGAPVADNGSRDGREQNRRVVLVVLR